MVSHHNYVVSRRIDYDGDILGGILNALYDSKVPLSTVEVWHATTPYVPCQYHVVRRILKSPEAAELIVVKQQVGGFGRRDYYLTPEMREEMEEWFRE